MSEEADPAQEQAGDEVKQGRDDKRSLARHLRERSEAVTAAVAGEMAGRGLDTRFARMVAEKALEALAAFESGTGEEKDEFAVHIGAYPLESQEAAVDLTDELMGALFERPRTLGVVGWTSGRNCPGLTFTVKAPDVGGAIRVALDEVQAALSRLGASPRIAMVEAQPAQWFWAE